MDDLFTEGVCFDTSTEGERGTLGWRPPLSTKVGAGGPCSIGLGQSEGPEESRLRKLRPYERSRCTEHGVSGNSALGKECARPTGGRHGRITDAPAQRFNAANLRATLEVG
jgi:hypothetical protein